MGVDVNSDSYNPGHGFEPLGAEDAQVDNKGRLRLPAQHVKHLQELKDEYVFITTLEPDSGVSVIYPISAWRKLQIFLDELATKDPEKAEDVETQLQIANHYGAVSKVDSQGRVAVPAQLRAKMDLNGKDGVPIMLDYRLGRYNVWPMDRYNERIGKAHTDIAGANKRLRGTGRL
jgi:DNA-binding transcriptional regulator/RsmH inhibitor MraZ